MTDAQTGIVTEFKNISMFRLKFRYYISTALYGFGVFYLGVGLVSIIPMVPLISTIVGPLVFALIAAYFLAIGFVLTKARTGDGKEALHWLCLCALVQILLGIPMRYLDLDHDVKDYSIGLLVVAGVISLSMLLVVIGGRFLFGDNVLTHKQIKFIYEQRKSSEASTSSCQSLPPSRSAWKYDGLAAKIVKFGSMFVGGGMTIVNLVIVIGAAAFGWFGNPYKNCSVPAYGDLGTYDNSTDTYYASGADDTGDQPMRTGGGYDYYNGGYGYDAGERLRTRQTGATPEQTKAVLDLFDRYGDIGQTEEQIWEKRRTAQRLGSDIGNFVADALDKGDGRISPENKQRIAQEAGEMFEQFGRVMMGGPEGVERTQQIQESYREYERQVEQQRQAEQMAVELLNIFGN